MVSSLATITAYSLAQDNGRFLWNSICTKSMERSFSRNKQKYLEREEKHSKMKTVNSVAESQHGVQMHSVLC